jgi:hypothetical protein
LEKALLDATHMKLAVLRPFEVVIWGDNKFVPIRRISVTAMSEDEAKESALSFFRRQYLEPSHVPTIGRIEVLSDVHLNPGRRQQTLFEDLADLCIGHSMDDVQGAAVNLLLTGVQRRARNQADAEQRWDELMGRGKQALIRRYRRDTDGRDKAAETEIAKKLFA